MLNRGRAVGGLDSRATRHGLQQIVGPEICNLIHTTSRYLAARRGPKPREVADHEEQVQKPEGEPDRCDEMKPKQEQDQTWRQEHRGVTQKPEAIRSPGLQRPFAVAHLSAKRAPVVVQRREDEREGCDTHRNQCDLEQNWIDPEALEPRVQKEQHEGEDRDVRPRERIRPGDVNCGKIFSHQMPPF